MRGFFFEIGDSETSRLDATRVPGRIRIYRARALYGRTRRTFAGFRILNYLWSLSCLVYFGLRAKALDGVYVATSELPHVALAGWVVGKLRRVPIVFCNLNVRGVDLWFANRWLHRTVDAVLTISRALAEELKAEGISVPIFVGTVGVHDGSLPRADAPAYDAIFVGRHTAEKGVFDLMRAWTSVTRIRPGARLLMIGPVQSAIRARLESEIVRLGLKGLVEIRGSVDEAAKWTAYANAKVCLFPSYVEGFGIVPLEAHLAGLAVVAYDLPVYKETIESSPAATLVAVGDIDAFAEAACEAIRAYPDERATTARSWASAFSWDAAAALESRLLLQALRQGIL